MGRVIAFWVLALYLKLAASLPYYEAAQASSSAHSRGQANGNYHENYGQRNWFPSQSQLVPSYQQDNQEYRRADSNAHAHAASDQYARPYPASYPTHNWNYGYQQPAQSIWPTNAPAATAAPAPAPISHTISHPTYPWRSIHVPGHHASANVKIEHLSPTTFAQQYPQFAYPHLLHYTSANAQATAKAVAGKPFNRPIPFVPPKPQPRITPGIQIPIPFPAFSGSAPLSPSPSVPPAQVPKAPTSLTPIATQPPATPAPSFPVPQQQAPVLAPQPVPGSPIAPTAASAITAAPVTPAPTTPTPPQTVTASATSGIPPSTITAPQPIPVPTTQAPQTPIVSPVQPLIDAVIVANEAVAKATQANLNAEAAQRVVLFLAPQVANAIVAANAAPPPPSTPLKPAPPPPNTIGSATPAPVIPTPTTPASTSNPQIAAALAALDNAVKDAKDKADKADAANKSAQDALQEIADLIKQLDNAPNTPAPASNTLPAALPADPQPPPSPAPPTNQTPPLSPPADQPLPPTSPAAPPAEIEPPAPPTSLQDDASDTSQVAEDDTLLNDEPAPADSDSDFAIPPRPLSPPSEPPADA